MAYYKVPQDVEADDKLVFGLTFKQFIFAIVFFVSGFVGFQFAKISIVLLGPILPIFIISGVLAFYRPKDQPAETKLLAYINYWFRPRRRLWSRDGLLEHVNIQAPKRPSSQIIVRSREQVHSQLKTLAQIVDTRGWATKQASIQVPTTDGPVISHDDRLVVPKELEVPESDEAAIDVQDELVSPLAQKIGQLAEAAEERQHELAINQVRTTQGSDQAQISGVHAFGQSASSDAPIDPRNLHVNKYPAMHQKIVDPQPFNDLAQNDDVPVSAIASAADRLVKQEDGAEFRIEH